MKEKNWFNRVFDFFVLYWSQLVTIGLAILGATIQILAKTQNANTSGDKILAWVLVVLALIAASQIKNERRLNEVMNSYDSKTASGDRYLLKSINGENLDLVRKAKTIDFIGVNLKQSLENWGTLLEAKVKEGTRIRIIMMDPDCPGGLSAAANRSNDEDENMLRSQYEYSIRKIKQLKKVSKFASGITLRLVKYPPSFAMILINQGGKGGWGSIKVYGHNGVLEGVHPNFEIYPWREVWWFEYFAHQFNSLWTSEKTIEVEL